MPGLRFILTALYYTPAGRTIILCYTLVSAGPAPLHCGTGWGVGWGHLVPGWRVAPSCRGCGRVPGPCLLAAPTPLFPASPPILRLRRRAVIGRSAYLCWSFRPGHRCARGYWRVTQAGHPRYTGWPAGAAGFALRPYGVVVVASASRARTASSTRSVWVSTFTLRQAWRTMPSESMMKVERSMPM